MKHILAYLILALAVAFALSPAFTDPFMGWSEDQLPIPQIDPPIQPAGYAFAIWGLIYAWLVVSAVYGAWKRPGDAAWHRARMPLAVSLALGVPWLAIANASPVWATITIVLMAAFAIAALIRAPKDDRWWFQAPTGIYAGWLTAASCVSIGSTAAGYGLLTGAVGWAFIGIVVALVVALGVSRLRPGAPEYLLTVVWALVGIVVANSTALLSVTALAVVGILILLVQAARTQRMVSLS